MPNDTFDFFNSPDEQTQATKKILIILSQKDQQDLKNTESMLALMLFASFGIEVHVLFRDAALSILQNSPTTDVKSFLKPLHNMVESFEFYDIEHLYVLKQDQFHPFVQSKKFKIKPIDFDQAFINQFDHTFYW